MEDRLLQQRLEKLERIRALGVDPYPHRFDTSHSAADALEQFDALSESGEMVSIAGRIMSMRLQGKAGFGHIQDHSTQVQVYFRRDNLEENFPLVKLLDLGDVIGVEGPLFTTRTGHQTIEARRVTLLSKSLRAMPVVKRRTDEDGDKEIFDEVTDKEMRYRRRYVDLAVNPEVREVFRARARILSEIRQFFEERDFLEVETPVLQPLYGGAAARPFVTHHNALDSQLYMRIADELYLKRLIVGGFDRVYEMAKNFRNEGMDRSHNPEFTSLEAYQAYADYEDMMELSESLFARVAKAIHGSTVIPFAGGTLDLTPPWERVSMDAALQEHAGVGFDTDDAGLREACRKFELGVADDAGRSKLLDALVEAKVEPRLTGPAFLIDYPVEISPLAKKKRDGDGRVVERFEVFIGGMEYMNAFSELNDPIEQRSRLEAQVRAGRAGDDESHPFDEDFLRSVEHGMPPTGGIGFGIDRMVMLFTDQRSIRDVLLFPAMRPETPADISDGESPEDDG